MKKKIVAFVLVFALALALGIGGTMAWLTAKTDAVVNTFTGGNITLALKEYAGSEELDTEAEKQFKIVPGATNDKEPKLTVGKGSEKCYLYACVTNSVKLTDGTVVATTNLDEKIWVPVATTGDKTVYRYYEVVDASAEDKPFTVFSTVTYSGAITLDNASQVSGDQITVQGYAHQSEHVELDGTGSANEAACKQFGVNYTDPTATPAT